MKTEKEKILFHVIYNLDSKDWEIESVLFSEKFDIDLYAKAKYLIPEYDYFKSYEDADNRVIELRQKRYLHLIDLIVKLEKESERFQYVRPVIIIEANRFNVQENKGIQDNEYYIKDVT